MSLNSTYALVTLEELKDFLAAEDGAYPTDVTLEPPLEATIDSISRWFSEYTMRQLVQAEVTEYHDGDGSTKLFVNSPPVADGSSTFYVDWDHDFGAETEVTPEIITDSQVYYSGSWPVGVKNIKAVYTGGYSTIPEDLKGACLIMCQTMWNRQAKGTSGVGQISIAGATLQLHVEKLAPPFVLDVLNRYRRPIC